MSTTELKTRTEYETTAECAKRVRKLLKETFPGVKFSVRSDQFAGGDAVRISYTDGPRESDVRSATRQFTEGTFDGMTDMYEFDGERGRIYVDTDGTVVRRYEGVKFVSVSRSMSAGAQGYAEGLIAMATGKPYDPQGMVSVYIRGLREYERQESGAKLKIVPCKGAEEYASRVAHQLLYALDLSPKGGK